jgi:hypothetical protein
MKLGNTVGITVMMIVIAMVITLTRETAVKNKDSNLVECDTLSLGESVSVL